MSAYPAWTPASRPGIVPLHPLGFGTVLGRSFAALRHNPRVLLGFALVVQGAAYLIGIAIIGAVTFAMFSRLQNVSPGSEAYGQIQAGSVGVTVLVAIVVSLLTSAFGVLVQAVVVVDVARGVLAEKPTLREIWADVRPVAWRLIGYAALLMATATVGVAIAVGLGVGAGALGSGFAGVALGIVVALLALLAGMPVWLWLNAKLLLTPAAILLENATVTGGIARSWRLTRGRFWPVLGVIVVIQAAFIALGEVVAVPFSLLGSLTGSVFAPTGGEQQALVVQLVVTAIVQIVVLVIQLVGSIVQATASALLYVDCRMRHEGLDLDLLSYIERRDAGETALPDPYTAGIGRVAVPHTPTAWGAQSVPAGAPWGGPPPAQPWGPPPQTPPASPYGPPPQRVDGDAQTRPVASPESAPPSPMAPPR